MKTVGGYNIPSDIQHNGDQEGCEQLSAAEQDIGYRYTYKSEIVVWNVLPDDQQAECYHWIMSEGKAAANRGRQWAFASIVDEDVSNTREMMRLNSVKLCSQCPF